MRVLLVGGGTGGPTVPLLAVAGALQQAGDVGRSDLLFVGTATGPEKTLVQAAEIPFESISAGKLRRYVSGWNVVDLFHVVTGFFQVRRILDRFQPDVVLTAGSFVAVPLVWAAKFKHIPVVVHQQDIKVGLANRLIRRTASHVTLTFPEQQNFFSGIPTTVTGNPVRDLTPTTNRFKKTDLPVVLIMGGGTGAAAINALVTKELCARAQVIHITGKGKSAAPFQHPNYQPVAFLTDGYAEALAKADIVISRAGMSSLSELATLGKPTIIIPIPGSHQEANARYFADRGAAIVLDQGTLTPNRFTAEIQNLLENPERQKSLSQAMQSIMPRDAAARVAAEIKLTAG